jgi:hypothetical protein
MVTFKPEPKTKPIIKMHQITRIQHYNQQVSNETLMNKRWINSGLSGCIGM